VPRVTGTVEIAMEENKSKYELEENGFEEKGKGAMEKYD